MAIRPVHKAGDTDQILNSSHDPGRIAIGHGPRRDVSGDHASGTDEGVFTYDYPRQYTGTDADLGSLFDEGASHTPRHWDTQGGYHWLG